MNHKLIGVAGLVALGTACATNSVDLEECAGDADVSDVTEIGWVYEDSLHELIACGQLTTRFVKSALESVAVVLGDPASAPEGLSYVDGVYVTEGTGLRMDLTPQYGPDSPGGSAGDPLGVDLFAADSWLVNPVAASEGDDVVVSFDSAGPLAVLLGQGADPPSPLTLTPDDLETVALNLGSLLVDVEIDIDESRSPATFTWHVKNGGGFLADLAAGAPMDLSNLTGASGTRDDLGQTMETTTWDVVYVDSGSALEGLIETEVTGGPFDFHVSYEYLPVDPAPIITMTCL